MSRLFDQMVERELHTFLFVDIAGYSLIADESGDEAAADLALDFLSRASCVAAAHGAEVVKNLGDAVMIQANDAADVIRLALELIGDFERDAALPELHAGLHTGPAVRRGDDWWGTTVNVAARVADAAAPGQLLVTEASRLAAGHVPATRWQGLEGLRLKNIRVPVKVYAASGIAGRRPERGPIMSLGARLPASRTVTA